MGGGLGGFLQRVEGAGADVAIDDAERADGGGERERGDRAGVGRRSGGNRGHFVPRVSRTAKAQSATPFGKLLQDFRGVRVRSKNRRTMPAVFSGLEVRRACRMV